MKLKDIDTTEGLTAYAQKAWGVAKVDITTLDPRVMKAAFEEIEKVIRLFPVLLGKISEISKSKIGAMSTTFSGVLTFNPTVFYSLDEVNDWYAERVSAGYFPKGTTWTNATVHEMGHRLVAEVIKTKYSDTNAMIEDWDNHLTATAIIENALTNIRRRYKIEGMAKNELLGLISYYASDNDSEAIAEAFSDVWSNAESANVVSVEIVKLLKELIP